MGRLFDADAYVFDPLSLPFWVVAAGVLWLLVYLLFTRGHPLIRTAVLGAVFASLLFSGTQAAAICSRDPEVAKLLYKLGVAPISLIGPALFALVLGAGNRLQPHRGLLALALVVALVSSVVTLATDLVVAGVWKTSWGILYTRAGPLNGPHVGMMVAWVVVGGVLARRGSRRERRRLGKARYRRVGIVLAMAPLAAADALLAMGIGVYPLSWLPMLIIMAVATRSALSGELIRRRGRDWATLWEALVVILLAAVVLALFALLPSARGVAAAGAVAAMVGAQLAVGTIRKRARRRLGSVASEVDRALDELAARSDEVRDEGELQREVAEFLDHYVQLPDAQLLEFTESWLVETSADGDTAPRRFPCDPRVKAWLLANRAPLLVERLDMMNLGGLREPIAEFLQSLEADAVLPLVDREILVGVIVTGERRVDRVLDDVELGVLERAQDAAARTLTHIQLYREAEARVEVAREVEIAAAVQHARTPGEERRELAGCEVASFYQPAGQFGGDWWMSAELPDGRLLVAIGDVTGHGVPAALVTSTVEGGCETALRMLGAGFNVFDLLHLLNRSVLDVGRSRYLMSCFAAAIDTEGMTVTFANAGHPFPYRCRVGDGSGKRAELRALVSRGTPLGVEAQPQLAVSRLDLAPDDLLVFYTDALVESENAAGERYGERRLQRALRSRLSGALERPCEAIMGDALAFYGSVPIREDITLVTARIGRG